MGGVKGIRSKEFSNDTLRLLAWSGSIEDEEINFLLKYLERLGYIQLGSRLIQIQ